MRKALVTGVLAALLAACGGGVPGLDSFVDVEDGQVRVTRIERTDRYEIQAIDQAMTANPGFDIVLVEVEVRGGDIPSAGRMGNSTNLANGEWALGYEGGDLDRTSTLIDGKLLFTVPDSAAGLTLYLGDLLAIPLDSAVEWAPTATPVQAPTLIPELLWTQTPTTTAPHESPTPLPLFGSLSLYVTGAVAQPDSTVQVAAGSTLADVLEAAGGATANADLTSIDLNAPAEGGGQLHVPEKAEGRVELVHINTADAAQLQALPGVGPVLAEAIVEHRAANGPFRAWADLLAVPGVSEATLAQWRGLVVFD
ncbi:MAG: ComEA family DNA-binding protein [Chloroflexi bacterium]|nr:ComEA family DNA-binding protein [Chloroflexota bacterium]